MMTWHERWGGAAGDYDAFADGYGESLRGDPAAGGVRRTPPRRGDADAGQGGQNRSVGRSRGRTPSRATGAAISTLPPGPPSSRSHPPAVCGSRRSGSELWQRTTGEVNVSATNGRGSGGRASQRKRRRSFCLEARVGRVHQRRVGPGRLVEHRLGVGEDVEAGLAVIRTHAARTDAAERQVGDGEVQEHVVERDAARRGAVDDLVEGFVARAERVQRERLVAIVDEADRLVDVGDRQHRQDRPEDLVAHHCCIGLHAGEHGRRDVPRVALARPARRRSSRSRRRRADPSAGRSGAR